MILETIVMFWPLAIGLMIVAVFIYWHRKRALDDIEWYNKRIEQQRTYYDSYTFRTGDTECLRLRCGDGGARASPRSSREEPDGDDWVH